jgi:hypothetical protein
MNVDLLRELLDLNQAFEQVIRGLGRMEKIPCFQAESIRYARAEVEITRVDANREFFEDFSEIVENDARWAFKFRREYDRKTQDPFDLYFELHEREEARKRKGLPPRAILLPGWDQDDEESEPEQPANKLKKATRKAKQRTKQGKTASKARRSGSTEEA